MSDYILPVVWENPTSMGGAWGGLNQPTAGARFEQTLPKGDQPFQTLYSSDTKWYQGNYHAGRIERTWCNSSRL